VTAPANANWPFVCEAVSFPSGPNTVGYPDYWMLTTGRTEGTWTGSRGRQYELDKVLTAQWHGTWQNTDGAFDPSNTSSIYYPQVVPYRAYRRRAQYPITNNKLNAAQATAGLQPNDDGSTVTGIPSNVYSGSGITVVTGGGNYTITVPNGQATSTALLDFRAWSVAPGSSHSAQALLSKTGAALTVQAAIQWVTATGASISTSTGSAVVLSGSGQVVSVSATAPSNAAGARFYIQNTTSPSGSSTVITLNSPQVEYAASPSAYAQPGTWYPFLTGYVLSWPQEWADAGTYGTSNATGIDAFGWLSQRKILSPAYMDILAAGPSYLYCLDEPSGSTLLYDATGVNQPIQPNIPTNSTGFSYTVGATLSVDPAGNTSPPRGIGGPVLQLASTGLGALGGPAKLPMTSAPGLTPPAGSAWTRIVAVNIGLNARTRYQGIWDMYAGGQDLNSDFSLNTDGTNGRLTLFVENSAGTILIAGVDVGPRIDDGGWHIIGVSLTADGKTVTVYVDGVQTYTNTVASTLLGFPVNTDVYYGPTGSGTSPSMQYACVAQFSYVLSAAQQAYIGSSFVYGGQGFGAMTSASRWGDVCRWGQWLGPQYADNYSTGETVNYGPATDLLATFAGANNGTDVATALNNITQTENGNGFMSAYGVATLLSRRRRYNIGTPTLVFGENEGAGEIPYTLTAFGYDPSRVGNDGQVTQQLTNNVARAYNASSASAQAYGDIPITRTSNTLFTYELYDYANYLVGKYQFPQQRLMKITISPASYTLNGTPNITAWTACLGLELGDVVRVNRRPPNAPEVTLIGFVEKISWSMDDATNATCELEVSAYSNQQFWQLGANSLTLQNAVTAVGATACVVNPMSDSATNPIQANVSSSGYAYEWIIAPGTASEELVTVTAPTPGTTSYTSATLNIGTCLRTDTGATGTGFRFTHAANTPMYDIGGFNSEITAGNTGATYVALRAYLASSSLNTYDVLGSTTICGF